MSAGDNSGSDRLVWSFVLSCRAGSSFVSTLGLPIRLRRNASRPGFASRPRKSNGWALVRPSANGATLARILTYYQHVARAAALACGAWKAALRTILVCVKIETAAVEPAGSHYAQILACVVARHCGCTYVSGLQAQIRAILRGWFLRVATASTTTLYEHL